MTWSTITLETDARGVARLTLNRPEKHNVLSGEMCDELAAAAARLDADAGVRVVVLTGAGRELLRRGRPRLDAGAVRRRPRRAAWPRRGGWRGMLQALNTLGKPLIGRVQRRGLRRRRRADGGLRRGGGGRGARASG